MDSRSFGVVLILASLSLRPTNGSAYYVAPNAAACGAHIPCHTLDYYAANSSGLRLTDSVFYFVPGTHFLGQTWTIDKASNLSLLPAPSATQGDEVVVNCSGISGGGISIANSRAIVLRNVRIVYCQQFIDGDEMQPSAALLFHSTSNLVILNLSVSYTRSSCLRLTNCTGFSIDHSTFSEADCSGIDLLGNGFGTLTSIWMLNNLNGVQLLQDDMNMVDARTDSFNNFDNDIEVASTVNITVLNSVFHYFYGISVDASPFAMYAIDVRNCTFIDTSAGINVDASIARYLKLSVVSCNFSTPTRPSILPMILVDASTPTQEGSCEVNVIIQNVTMKNLSIVSDDVQFPIIYMYSIQRIELSNVSVVNNRNGGLELYNSIAIFQGHNSFVNNSAINGGGIALYGNSYIFLNANSTLEIINNTASIFGGGVYVQQDLSEGGYCSLQVSDDQAAQIKFQGNKAGYTGSDLYGGDIVHCFQVSHASINSPTELGLLINASMCHQTEVSSDAVNLTFCDDHCINTSTTELMMCTYPGVQFNVSIAALGQFGGLTQAIAIINYDEVFYRGQEDQSAFVNFTCTNVTLDMRAKKTNIVGKIYLTVSDFHTSIPSKHPITIVVDIKPCPAGFNLSTANQTCICADSISKYAECDIMFQNISRYGNSWILPTIESVMIFEPCPFDYCNNETFFVNSPDNQCAYNRAGMLCGECVEGYSLSLGSNQCLKCDRQLWKVPTIIVGSAIAGILLITLLIVLDLTISVGTINGLLFFVNIVKIFESILFHTHRYAALEYFISWLNLDLGVPVCFFEGMDACQKVGLQFVFPLYLFALVMLIVAVCRCGQWAVFRSIPCIVKLSDKTTMLMGSKAIPVLATLILLSYTKLVRAIILIYHKANVQVFENNSSVLSYSTTPRWYVNGSVEYLAGCHGILFGVSTAIVVPVLFTFMAFLLLFPLMERHLPRLRCWTPFHIRLKPWYDAYGGPYKDRYRSWSGFLLLVRCLLVLVVTLSNDSSVSLSILTWLCLILIPLVALLQVYKSFLLNVLEIVYISCIFAMVSFTTTPYGVQLYLILVIQVCLLASIVLFHVCQRLKSTNFANFVQQKFFGMQNNSLVDAQADEVDEKKDNSKRSVNTSHTTIKFDELREPLLEEQSYS